MREESGQVLVLLVLAMFLILGVAAYALDAAQLGVAHHQAQVAADAAALSAAQDMSTTAAPTPAQTTAINTAAAAAATTNDPSATATVSQPTTLKAQATVHAPVSLPFGHVFGFGSGSATATATAQVNTAVTNVDGTILSVGCGNRQDSSCTYCAGTQIPTGQTQADDGWQVTNTAEEATTAFTPTADSSYATDHSGCKTTTAGETTVNLQTCNGARTEGNCYDPGSLTPETTTQQQNIEVVDLNGQSEGGMWQTVPTTIGARYVLNFWLTGNPGLNGWPAQSTTTTNNNFPVDVYVTTGAYGPYTPSYNEASTPASPCASHQPAAAYFITCGWWDYQDQVCGATNVTLTSCTSGLEQGDFTEESLTFIATTSSTTITFNSEVYDGDQQDTAPGANNDYWFFCGPEVANISVGYPEIQLVQ